MRAGALTILLCGWLPGCILYPTIERTPEPRYAVLQTDLERVTPTEDAPIGRYEELRNPQRPFYNPRLADDLWYEIAEWIGPFALRRGYQDLPLIEEADYWFQRETVHGYGANPVNTLTVKRASTDFEACVWVARSGRELAAIHAWPGCKNLDTAERKRAYELGQAWRKRWLFTTQVTSCVARIKYRPLSEIRAGRPGKNGEEKCTQVKDWSEVVRYAEIMLPRWEEKPVSSPGKP